MGIRLLLVRNMFHLVFVVVLNIVLHYANRAQADLPITMCCGMKTSSQLMGCSPSQTTSATREFLEFSFENFLLGPQLVAILVYIYIYIERERERERERDATFSWKLIVPGHLLHFSKIFQ